MTDKLYVAYTNTDPGERLPRFKPFAYSYCKQTAERLVKEKREARCSAHVYAVDIERINGEQYISLSAVYITEPTTEDIEQQKKADAKAAVIAKAKAAGLSEEELSVLLK